MEQMQNPMGNIYDQDTSSEYYKVVGKEVETKEKNENDKFLESLIPEDLSGKTVLDLGAGNGRHSELLAQRGADRVIALDLSQNMIDQIKARKEEKNIAQLEIVQASMDDLDFAKNEIDYIFSRFSLMYASDLPKTIQALSDMLRENGEALLEISVMTIDDAAKELEIKKGPVPLIVTASGQKVHIKNFAHDLQEHLDALEKAGLKITTMEQFPADELSVDPNFIYANDIKLNYVVFKVVKIKNE